MYPYTTKYKPLGMRQQSEKLSLVTFYYDKYNIISFTMISVWVEVSLGFLYVV